MTVGLAPHVLRLLETRINDFEKLEIVLALRAAPNFTMTIDELQQAIRLSRETLRELVAELSAAKLLEHTARGALKLAPASSRDTEAIDDLAAACDRDQPLVARTLAELAVARIRGMAEQALVKKPPG